MRATSHLWRRTIGFVGLPSTKSSATRKLEQTGPRRVRPQHQSGGVVLGPRGEPRPAAPPWSDARGGARPPRRRRRCAAPPPLGVGGRRPPRRAGRRSSSRGSLERSPPSGQLGPRSPRICALRRAVPEAISRHRSTSGRRLAGRAGVYPRNEQVGEVSSFSWGKPTEICPRVVSGDD